MTTYVTIGRDGHELITSDYTNEDSPTHVRVRDGVTSIQRQCFYNVSTLISIIISDSVRSLGNYCFYDCSNLTSITIGNSVRSLGNYCFEKCTSLTSIEIPDSVRSLLYKCFCNCTSLTSIEIPDSVTSIGYGCFEDCTNLTSITIGNGVTSIGDNCFKFCSSLKYVTYDNITYEYVGTNYLQITTHVISLVLNDDYTNWLSPPTLGPFTIDPSNITVENHGTINMVFSDDRIKEIDISNSLTVDPSNAGIIDNINETSIGSNNWTAIMTPYSGLKLID